MIHITNAERGRQESGSRSGGQRQDNNMATRCSDPSVLAGLFLAAYSGNLADVKSVLKNNALSADVADPEKVRARKSMCERRQRFAALLCLPIFL